MNPNTPYEALWMSDENLRVARAVFETRRRALTTAEVYGTSEHVAEATAKLRAAAEVYATRLTQHAALVAEYHAAMAAKAGNP